MRRNPYLFVVGCPRSGTTLLQRMLDHHPQLAVANDTHFIPRAIDGVTGEGDPPLTSGLVEAVLGYRRFPRLGLAEATAREAATGVATYGEFVSALYTAYARARGKPLAGEKTPDYVKSLARLHALLPWVRSVHIVRDGRDVALSTLEWARSDKGPGRYTLWEEEPVAVCSLWWRRMVTTGRRDGAALGPARYREVRYEDLVARPGEVLRDLVAFLDLPDAVEMANYHEGKTRLDPGLSAKKAWLPPTPGLRDWRTQMRERDVAVFEAISGDLLSTLGYERSVPRIPPAIAAVADRCRQWWESEMAAREAKARRARQGSER